MATRHDRIRDHIGIEQLEARKLLAITVIPLPAPAPVLSGYDLKIQGTLWSDEIAVSASGASLQVRVNSRLYSYNRGSVLHLTVLGNDGDDSISIASGVTTNANIDAGDGNDVVVGGGGKDTIHGGRGNDSIDGGAGADDIWGDEGWDDVNYRSRTMSVNVSLDNIANDGGVNNQLTWNLRPVPEADNVHSDIETVWGGSGADTIRGSAAANDLYGMSGDDTIYGGGGNDRLFGWLGNDSLSGEDGDDQLSGEDGDDRLSGGSGKDVISGGRGVLDLVTYENRSVSVYVSLSKEDDSRARDGQDGEGDSVWSDVEGVAGGSGSDTFVGSDAANTFYGNGGDDNLDGGLGDDKLYGGAGNDDLRGGGGNDNLDGGSGGDRLFGGVGVNTLQGGADDDILVSIGGGADTVNGGAGFDSFWMDAADRSNDADAGELSSNVHIVRNYETLVVDDGTNPKTSMTPGLDEGVTGLLQPATAVSTLTYVPGYSNFSGFRLFASEGPSEDDVAQGNVGDCGFLSGLAGFASRYPNVIKQAIADLGDGTYAVRFFRADLSPVYYRVDSQLTSVFAGLGRQHSIWVPLLEKAFTFYRQGKGTYASIEGGGAVPAFGSVGKGATTVWGTSADSTLKNIKTSLEQGKVVVASTVQSGATSGVWAQHSYTVVSVQTATVGSTTSAISITLRNPKGRSGPGTVNSVRPAFGTLTADEFYKNFLTTNAGDPR